MKYQTLEHKADLKIRVFGKTKEELFQNALLGMEDSLRAKAKSPRRRASSLRGRQKAKIKIIKVKSLDINSLLVDFLSEVLYLNQVDKEIYTKIKFKKFSDTELKGELIGQKVERFGEDIKAVTHHGLNVYQKKDKNWETTILFDI